MPTFDPDLAGALRSLQRQIDQINTSPPGPVSYGPGDHARFYGADGTTVLFEAVGGSGASVVSRGSLTSMTSLFDGIRDKNDAQDGVLSDHRGWIVGHGERLDGHDGAISRIDGVNDAQNGRLNDHHGWIGSLGTRMGSAEGRLDGHDSTLSSHGTTLGQLGDAVAGKASTARVDGIAGSVNRLAEDMKGKASTARTDQLGEAVTAVSHRTDTAQARADSAYSRAGTGISNAAAAASAASSAQSRADAAYSLAATRAAASTVSSLDDYVRAQVARLDARINALPKG